MTAPLHIIADSNIWGANHAFQTLAGFDVVLDILEHQAITPQRLQHADILLVRSSSQVNASLLKGSPVRFVGTATIGDDHIDQLYLQENNIAFASAAGSSTASVVEYMLAALYRLEQHNHLVFKHDTLGIIGVGRIGSLLEKACLNLGLKTLCNDPPRAKQEKLQHFKDLDYLLQHADILTLHTPLLTTKNNNTRHLLNKSNIEKFQGRGIINVGRGACLDNQALLLWLNQQPQRFAILDCWEGEPAIHLKLLQHPQVYIATPHIAGHSLDGKAANTQFVYNALCAFLNIKPTWDKQQQLPPIIPPQISEDISKSQLSALLYPIMQDTSKMKDAGKQSDSFQQWFKTYRRHYPVRRSWEKTLSTMKKQSIEPFF